MESITLLIGRSDLLLLAACCLIAVLNTAIGLAASRQWHLLPLAAGLTALAGFLMNPVADANSTEELSALLLADSVLLPVSVFQLILIVAAFAATVRMVSDPEIRFWGIAVGVIHTVTSPILLVQMLIAEHWLLLSLPNSRPESVGLWIGIAGGSVVAGLTLIGLLFTPDRRNMASLSLCTVSGLMSILMSAAGQSLPAAVDVTAASQIRSISLSELCVAVAVSAVLVGLGFVTSMRSSELRNSGLPGPGL
ncbi:MAG: hypothetical protein JNL58_13210 [Planctomyces sp.]|nr:hypothetical protein [Planctomyces sp.]